MPIYKQKKRFSWFPPINTYAHHDVVVGCCALQNLLHCHPTKGRRGKGTYLPEHGASPVIRSEAPTPPPMRAWPARAFVVRFVLSIAESRLGTNKVLVCEEKKKPHQTCAQRVSPRLRSVVIVAWCPLSREILLLQQPGSHWGIGVLTGGLLIQATLVRLPVPEAGSC